uniref:Uncharacterized protein n=1 Tax=Vespula pensylvanica TaxID=30213 RepID=A0A834P103_VESPE|nr:hypothetical protein H0235_008996 [Vespula pensylvanica]
MTMTTTTTTTTTTTMTNSKKLKKLKKKESLETVRHTRKNFCKINKNNEEYDDSLRSRNMHQLQNYMEANDVSNENSSKDKDSDDISGSKIADAKKTDLIRVIKRFVDRAEMTLS